MILYGASGHAKVIAEILEHQQKPVTGLVDGNTEIENLLGYPVYHTFAEAVNNKPNEVIIAIGNNAIRKRIAAEIQTAFGNAVHPSANISLRSTIGEGTVIMAGVAVNSSSGIGRHVILNTNCIVDHDCFIEDYVHISPNAAIAGNVKIGEGTHIGIGASVIQGIIIGKWVTIGAGAVIIKDVPDYAVVVGNPGKIIKFRKS